MSPTPTAAATLTAQDVIGLTYELTPGVIDTEAVMAFTRGQCAELAIALHDRTGWPLRVLVQGANSWMSLTDEQDVHEAARAGDPLPFSYLSQLWGHVMVQRPDGRLVDIYGARTADTVLAEHTGNDTGTCALWNGSGRDRIVALDRDTADRLPSTAPRARGIGGHFVDAVLALPDVPPCPWPWQHSVRDHIASLASTSPSPTDDADDDAMDALLLLAEEDLLDEAVARGLVPGPLLPVAERARAELRC